MCQTVTRIVAATAEEPPPPLEDLQLELDVAEPAAAASGAGARRTLQERTWARAVRMDAAASSSGTAAPLAALQLGGAVWKLHVRALPILCGREPPGGSGAAAAGGSSLGSMAGFIGNGADSSTPPGSPLSQPATTPRAAVAPSLPRSDLERVAIPAVEAAGLRCVRMFWNVLVGDVVVGLLGDGSGFSADGGALAAAVPGLLDFADAPDVGDPLEALEPPSVSGGLAAAQSPQLLRSTQHAADEVDSTAVEVERVLRTAYRVRCPEIPRVAEGVPEDAAGNVAAKALHEGMRALLDTGVAHCERMHVLLLERFKVVAGRLDEEEQEADVAGLQDQLNTIVERNALLRGRVAAALKVRQLATPPCCARTEVLEGGRPLPS